MLQSHKNAFFQVADKFNCWIGLREPNELSDSYIGQAGYTAKSEHCKAKSADNPHHHFRGLVVSPEICPGAFLPQSLNTALDKWKGFARKMPIGFSVDERKGTQGLVKYFDKFIHADFDLMYVNKAGERGNLIYTTQHEADQLFRKVGPMLNCLLGSEMIQHGPEFAWSGGVGARESEYVLSFGPNRGFRRDISSMPQVEGTMN